MTNKWINDCEALAINTSFSEKLYLENLELSIQANNKSLVNWVHQYLFPSTSLKSSNNIEYKFTLSCIYSDEIVAAALKDRMHQTKVHRVDGNNNRKIDIWADKTTKRVVHITDTDGVVWLSNPEEQKIIIVYSSRSKYPSLEFSRTTRALISQYLHNEGWFLCHAGAVSIEDKNYYILGNSGAGKTTLILALLQSGASYIANELVYAKPADNGLKVLSFPIPIAIGLGTCLQFKNIGKILENPYQLSYPARRISFHKIMQFPKKDWIHLKDKIQVLPKELETLFVETSIKNSGIIDKIVIPKISFHPINTAANKVNYKEGSNIFTKNIISIQNRKFASPWLITGFTPEKYSNQDLVNSIKHIPFISLDYHVSLEQSENQNGFQHFIDEIVKK